ncbi:hypothetical protein V1264_015081 [Littorina saxatilis]|uniref:Reverse transcriptase domain-containing protein n=1 Tax=Littorina saxatilis TaxID=31220 RepID=A0AAN9BL30_9CAEN
MFNWIKSFLCHRTARVKLDGNLSYAVKIREGVPQGGVISPTLFVVFINITNSLSRHISRALHADDLTMWSAAESTATAKVGGPQHHREQPQDRSHLLLPLQFQRDPPTDHQQPGNTTGRHPYLHRYQARQETHLELTHQRDREEG